MNITLLALFGLPVASLIGLYLAPLGLALTIRADGSSEHELVGASKFPRHWVYGCAGRPCLRCATPVVFTDAARTPHGRETWWCPGCQR